MTTGPESAAHEEAGARPTLEDVAARAGVSRTSASRALLGQPKISEANRERVRRAAEELGYIPNTMASRLAGRLDEPLVGVLLRDAANPAYGLLHVSLQNAAQATGLRLVTTTITADRHDRGQRAALHHLLGLRVSALLVATGGMRPELLVPFARQTAIVRIGRPEDHPEIHAISYDEEHGGAGLAAEILRQGHRHAVVIATRPEVSYPESVRAAALAGHLRAGGAQVETVVPAPAADPGARAALEAAVRSGASVIAAPTDLRALAVLRETRARGIDVPGRVSVTGWDGVLPGADLIGLTSWRIPIETAAARAIELVASLIAGSPSPTVHERLPGHLVPGSTLQDVQAR